jgi:hypothetical protein
MSGLYGLYAYDRSEAVKLVSPAIFRTLKHSVFGMLLIFLIFSSFIGIGSAAVYQLPDTTTDQGMVGYRVENQYSQNQYYLFGLEIPFIGKISTLPFLGGYGSDSANVDHSNTTYFVSYDYCEFNSAVTDAIGEVSFKIDLPESDDFNTYILPVKFTTNDTSQQFYLKIYQHYLSSYTKEYVISVCDGNQSAFLNKTIYPLAAGSPLYITFGNEKIKINRVNSVSDVIDIYDNETGSASTDLSYSFCNNLQFDISGYPYPAQCNFKVYDGYEFTKTYDSIPMKIYWLINQVIPDNNQNMYYFFRAVDTVWSTSLSIILLCFSMPFMWLFFAGICGLCTCVLRGSLTSGVPAGIKTFISVSLIPVKLMGFILEMIARLITAIKPI